MGIKLSISNIAWTNQYDNDVYAFLKKNEIQGLEIAPTRVFGTDPYDNLERAKKFRKYINEKYNLKVCSLQSIWFGRREKLFGTVYERQKLMDYTKKAILFAEVIGAKNLVFGSPKNREYIGQIDKSIEYDFFSEIACFAAKHNTVISIEPNPQIYGTNYINYTKEAIELVKSINSIGLKVNLDLGTVIQNKECLNDILSNIDLINHVHISEPYLDLIPSRVEHKMLISKLINLSYDGYISIEMKKQEDINNVYKAIDYLQKIIRECK